jgi:hypothetical protein
VARQDLPFGGGHRSNLLTCIAIEVAQLLGIALAVLSILGSSIRIGRGQCICDIMHINYTVGGAVPGMRIGELFSVLLHVERTDAVAGNDGLALIAGGGDQTIHPAFESEAADEHKVGRFQFPRVIRAGFERVWIAVRPDQARDLDAIAPDLMHHVGKHCEAGDDLERLRCGRAAERPRQQGKAGGECNPAPSDHAMSPWTIR